jgi:hypothetical protein
VDKYIDVVIHKIVIGRLFFAKTFYPKGNDQKVAFDPCYNYLVDHVFFDDPTTCVLPVGKRR